MEKASVWRQVQQQQQQASGGGGVGSASNAAVPAASPACRPTGARWTPTQEQVTILKELYYGCGIRSPNAEQIQRIASRLRQFGKIEGKNVFYWFQNHKARERHKKRLAVDASCPADAAAHPGVLSPSTPGSGAAASSGGFYGACNGREGSAMQMDMSTTTTCWGDSTWTAGAGAATSSGSFFSAGNGGRVSAVPMDGSTTTTCWGDSAAGIGATERNFVQLQDYMGVTRSTGAGSHGHAAAPTRWPACFSFSTDQLPTTTTTTTREPETLPLFPTGGQQHEGGGDHGSYLQSNSSFQRWGAAATTNAMTFQQHHQQQLQEQQQYSFYSNQQLMMMPSHSQDAGTSLELTLSHPAGYM